MLKIKGAVKIAILGAMMALIATPAFARTIELTEAGTALWIFLLVGTIIILLQLIPAGILFFSFMGTATGMVFRKGRTVEEEVTHPLAEPAAARK
jgi:hypothetical protein